MNFKFWVPVEPSLSWTEVTELLRTVTYKPGYSLGWQRNQVEFFVLKLDAPVEDADRPGVRITITFVHSIKLPVTRTKLIEELYKSFVAFETHEAGEFFRVGNTKPFYPHGVRSVRDL